jgi:hypothetical protein
VPFGSTLIKNFDKPYPSRAEARGVALRGLCLLIVEASNIFLIPFFFFFSETSSIDIGAVIHHDLGQCVFTRDT